ncbi:MAG: hypothetical protein HN353_10700 [Bdellovibrionales bacterium]|nr:hypothetical protein [Bdellovibrionales bacterium]MBT3524763.1 hypothetical protein [Bdellovibrionales bacterium]
MNNSKVLGSYLTTIITTIRSIVIAAALIQIPIGIYAQDLSRLQQLVNRSSGIPPNREGLRDLKQLLATGNFDPTDPAVLRGNALANAGMALDYLDGCSGLQSSNHRAALIRGAFERSCSQQLSGLVNAETIKQLNRLVDKKVVAKHYSDQIFSSVLDSVSDNFLMLEHQLSERKLNLRSIAKQICSGCQKDEYNHILARLTKQQTILEDNGVRRFSPQALEHKLNMEIRQLNASLVKVTILAEDDKFSFQSEESRTAWEQYHRDFVTLHRTPAIELLRRVGNQSLFGQRRGVIDGEEIKGPKNTTSAMFSDKATINLVKHPRINQRLVTARISQAKSDLVAGLKDIREASDDSNSYDSLKEMVSLSPFAAGRLLAQHPEYASVLCDVLGEIQAERIRGERYDKIFSIGMPIAAGLLALTGVGLVIAGPMLAAGTMTSMVATGALYGATTIGATSSGYLGYKIIDDKYTQGQFNTTCFGGDDYSCEQAQLLEERIDQTAKELLIGAGTTLAGFGILKSGGLITRSVKSATATSMRKVDDLLRSITKDPKLKELFTKAGKLLGTNSTELQHFLGRLAHLPKKRLAQVLERFKKMTPEKLKKVIRKTVRKTNRSCKIK